MIFIVDACHSGNLNGGIKGIERTASALASSWVKNIRSFPVSPTSSPWKVPNGVADGVYFRCTWKKE